MRRVYCFGALLLWAAGAGCTVDVPLGTGAGLTDMIENLQAQLERLVEDPLATNPYPLLIGGDSQVVYYATSLTDVRLNFRGRANDLILPSPIGPSNLYVYDDGERRLLKPLIATGAFLGFRTDGHNIAYVRADLSANPPVFRVVAADLYAESEQVYYDSALEPLLLNGPPRPLALANDRLAFALFDPDREYAVIRLVDLRSGRIEREIQGEFFPALALRSDLLAYAEYQGSAARIVLLNLSTDHTLVVAQDLRLAEAPAVILSSNKLVWSEPSSPSVARVRAYDIPTGVTRVWVDSAAGWLAGATDDYFVTEEYVEQDNGVERIAVRRYDLDGAAHELANFRADGLAGQTQVIGDSAAWVNPERRVTLAPLAGGSRTQFRPF